MKKTLLILIPLFFITLLSASHLTPVDFKGGVDLTYGGEFRTRAIMFNDPAEYDGGWFDNRLRFDINAKLADKLGVTWTTEVGNIVWGGPHGYIGTSDINVKTRELYLDYQMSWMDMKVRMGQQYWYDHRSLVLDDYFSGVTTDLTLAGISTELGFIKVNEGALNQLDDAHVAFANVAMKAPFDCGLTAMFGQNHAIRTADIWLIPYFMMNFAPISIDLTAVVNNKMFPENAEGDESEMGIAFAAKADVDMGFKIGADLLYVTEEGINVLSPYYENGLYLFGNKLPYDGVQISSSFNGGGQAYMSIVGKVAYPFNDKMDFYGAVGMATVDDPIGMELNVGMNYIIMDGFTFNPVLAVGQTGKAIDYDPVTGKEDTNMVYMLGGLFKAEF
jgi:hypothetical protein